MNVKLSHSKHISEWSSDWIYLGSNYQLMRKNENKINGNRISINNLLKHDSKDNRIEWMEWLEKQRQENNDSLFWGMTHIAGRNNTASKFYLYVLQIKSIINRLLYIVLIIYFQMIFKTKKTSNNVQSLSSNFL